MEFLRPKRKYEVGGSARNIITCPLIDLIRENHPNVICYMKKLAQVYRLKGGVGTPDRYLGGNIETLGLEYFLNLHV